MIRRIQNHGTMMIARLLSVSGKLGTVPRLLLDGVRRGTVQAECKALDPIQ